MVDFISKYCAETEYALTPKALKRLRLYSAMALIGFPVFSVVEMFDLLSDIGKPIHFIITTALLLSFIPLLSDRIYNRFSRKNSKLDEREHDAMRQAQAFSYKVVLFSLVLSVIVGLTSLALLGVEFKTPYINVGTAAITFMNIVCVMVFLPITFIAWTQKPILDEF